jgi:ribosomal protein S27AE
MPEIFKKVCPKCGSSYMQKRPSAPDTDWVCAKCGEPVNFNSAQHRLHLTAFGALLAWLFFGALLLLAMVLFIIGVR